MPIQFRCTHCGQLLSISRKKAGSEVTCPQCVHRTAVPNLEPTVAAPVSARDDESGMRLAIVQPKAAESIAPPEKDAWKKHPNAWLQEEDEEEEFKIQGVGLQEAALDMTPMVDVTFLLLIFFMITASFAMQKSLPTSPPEPEQEGAAAAPTMEELEAESVVVEIDEENNLRVDDVPVAGIGELTDVLQAKLGEGKVEMLIEVNPAAKHGTVVAVTDAGITAQMQRIRRTTRKSDD